MSTSWADDIYRSDNGRSILDALTLASPMPAPDETRAIRFDCIRLAIGLGVAKNTDELLACARALYAFVAGEDAEKLERFANWLNEPARRPTEDERRQARAACDARQPTVADAMQAMSVTGSDAIEPKGDDRVLEWLELPTRAWNCLKDGGYRTIGDVRRASDKELLALNNLGRRTLDQIRSAIWRLDRQAGRLPDLVDCPT